MKIIWEHKKGSGESLYQIQDAGDGDIIITTDSGQILNGVRFATVEQAKDHLLRYFITLEYNLKKIGQGHNP